MRDNEYIYDSRDLAKTTIKTHKEIIDDIEHGIFWPPSSKKDWQYDYSDWISETPEESLSPEWLADQLRRIEERDKRRSSK